VADVVIDDVTVEVALVCRVIETVDVPVEVPDEPTVAEAVVDGDVVTVDDTVDVTVDARVEEAEDVAVVVADEVGVVATVLVTVLVTLEARVIVIVDVTVAVAVEDAVVVTEVMSQPSRSPAASARMAVFNVLAKLAHCDLRFKNPKMLHSTL
jgi:hypothetical protein